MEKVELPTNVARELMLWLSKNASKAWAEDRIEVVGSKKVFEGKEDLHEVGYAALVRYRGTGADVFFILTEDHGKLVEKLENVYLDSRDGAREYYDSINDEDDWKDGLQRATKRQESERSITKEVLGL